MIDLDFYCFDIKMQKDILKRCEVFTERIKPLMSEYLFNPKDARNMIKMCPYPHCGIIWFKTEGCNGQIECGKKVQNWYDFIGKPFKTISSFRDTNGQLKWKKSNRNKEMELPKFFIRPSVAEFALVADYSEN